MTIPLIVLACVIPTEPSSPASPPKAPRLYRVILQVGDVERAAAFYGELLDIDGRRVSPGRNCFDCGGTILALLEPRADGDASAARPNPDHVYPAVADVETVHGHAAKPGGP